jgi:hypothetical protein
MQNNACHIPVDKAKSMIAHGPEQTVNCGICGAVIYKYVDGKYVLVVTEPKTGTL